MELTINSKILLTAGGIALISFAFFPLYAWLLVAGLGVVTLYHFFGERVFIFLFVVSLLTLTSSISVKLRTAVQLLDFIFLGYFFIREYGLEFEKYPTVPKNVSAIILFYLIILFFSSLTSSNITLSFVYFSKQVLFFVIIYILYSLINSEETIFLYLYSLIISGVILSLSILYLFFQESSVLDFLISQGFIYLGGIYSNVTAAGGILVFSISLSLFFTLKREELGIKLNKYLFYILLPIQFVALLLTNSRSAILTVAIITGLILFKFKRNLFYLVAFVILILGCSVVIFSPSVREVFAEFLRIESILRNNRFIYWDIALKIIRDNFFLGVGPGMFGEYIFNYLPISIYDWRMIDISYIYESSSIGHAHNFILFIFSELGVLGLIISLTLLITAIRFSRKLSKQNDKAKMNINLIGTFTFFLIIGLLVRAVFEATGFLSYGWISRDLPFWIIFSVVIYLNEKLSETNL